MSICRSQRRFLNLFYPRVVRLLQPRTASLCTSASESTEQHHQEQSHQESDGEDVRERLYQASLQQVHQHGFTRKAIIAAAEAEGLPSVAHGMFPRGAPDLIAHFYVRCNADLEKKMAAEVAARPEGAEKPRVSEFIKNAVWDRIMMVEPYREQWPQAVAIMALPQNQPTAWRHMFELVDTIWHYAGDKSVDYNWYTKRLSLVAVCKATGFYMLQDNSPELEDTYAFLERRLDDLAEIGRLKRNIQDSSGALYSAGVFAQNMLGLGMKSNR